MDTLADYLAQYLTPERKARMEGVLAYRTRYLTVVLEDIYQPHNASAVLRTCDALGVQDVHVVEKKNSYKPNPDIALGSAQWLNVHGYKGDDGIRNCYKQLKADGYRVVATTPHTRAKTLDELPLDTGKIALVFGTELTGLTQPAMDEADEYVYIPMYGFVESFNISVTAAISLHHLGHKLRTSTVPWQLPQEERDAIWLSWLRNSIKSAPALEKRFYAERGQAPE